MRLLMTHRQSYVVSNVLGVLLLLPSILFAQLPDLSPAELAQRHEAMVQKIETAQIVTDMIYATDPSFNETTKFWMQEDERRFIVEPFNRAMACQDCYFDGAQLFRIQRANADRQVPAKVSIWTSSGLIGIIQKDTDINQLNYTLWVSMLRFRLNMFDADWSLPDLVKASTPPATSGIVNEGGKELYVVRVHHPGIKWTNVSNGEQTGRELRIYLDPARNFAAVRAESEMTSSHQGAQSDVEWFITTQGEWARSDAIWISTETICSVVIDGKANAVTRKYQINVVQLNQPIAPGVMEMRFPENMVVGEVDSAGVTHDMHLIDDKGAFKKTFKTPEAYHSWLNQQQLGGPYWSPLLAKWPFFAGGLMFLLFAFLLWRTTRRNVQPAQAD